MVVPTMAGMEKKMNEQKIKEVFADEAFVESLLNMENAEDVCAALAEKDIEVSIADVVAIRDMLVSKDGELSEEDLENVSGGVVIATVITVVCGIISASCGAANLTHNVTRGRW